MKRLFALFLLFASPVQAQNTFFAGNPGDMIYRGTTAWQRVPGGTAGQILQSNGPTAAPTWSNGFDVYTTYPFVLPRIATNRALMNVTGANAAPTPGTVSQFLDTIGYDTLRPPGPGSIIYKSANPGTWQALPVPNPVGWVLTTQGPQVPPQWGAPTGGAFVVPGVAGTCLVSTGPSTTPDYEYCITQNTTIPAGFAGFLVQAPDGQNIDLIWRQQGHSQSVIQQFYYQATNSVGANSTYGQYVYSIQNATAGSEQGEWQWYNKYQGTYGVRFTVSGGAFAGAYADEGPGTINGILYNQNSPVRTTLVGTTFYVSPTGTDASSIITCQSTLTPCARADYIYNQLATKYDTQGQTITIQYKDGTYNNHVFYPTSLTLVTPAQVILQGHINADGSCTRSSVIVVPPSPGASYAFGGNGIGDVTISCMTLGSTGLTQTGDFIAFGQGPTLRLQWLESKNNGLSGGSTPNFLSMSGSGFLYLQGDLWINSDQQAAFYLADNISSYPNINNSPAVVLAGTTTSGSKIVTNIDTTSLTQSVYIVRGTAVGTVFPEATFIASVDVVGVSGQITTTANATATGVQSLTVGGLFVNYVGTRSFYVSNLYFTTGASLNLQGMTFRSCLTVTNCASTGTVNGQIGIIQSGAHADFGLTDPTTVPGSSPWFIEGQVGSGLISQTAPGQLELPKCNKVGNACGVSAPSTLARIRFTEYLNTGSTSYASGNLATSSIGEFTTLGPGSFKWLGNDGAVNYGLLTNLNTNANPSIALGIGTITPAIQGVSAGIHIYDAVASHTPGILIENADPTPANQSKLKFLANTAFTQINTVSNTPFYIAVNDTTWWYFRTTGFVDFTNIVAPSTPASGLTSIYVDSTNKRLHDKNDAGTIGTTVVADTGAANNFLTAISASGVISKAQPAFTDLSGTISVAQVGGSGAAHAVPVDVAGTITWKVVPDCTDASGRHLNYTQSTDAWSCGTGTGNAITALTGDVTATGPGSVAATLASVITAGGPIGSPTSIPVITYDAKGRLTTVTTATPTVTSVNGVAYPASYASGGVPYASGTGTIASSAILGTGCIVYGGGAGNPPLTSTSTCPTVSSAGIVTVNNATDASAIGTAAFVTPGGGSIAKQLRVGGVTTTVDGNIVSDNGVSASSLNFKTRGAGSVSFYDATLTGRYFFMAADASRASYNYLSANAVGSGGNPYFQAISGTGDTDVGTSFFNTGAGAFNFYTAGGTLRLSIGSSGLTLTALSPDTATTDSTLCGRSSDNLVLKGTGALGICLGTSGRQFKTDFAPMGAGLAELMQIDLLNYRYKQGYGDSGLHLQYGPTAQGVGAVLPDIVRYNSAGEAINYDWGALLFVGLHSIQQLKADNDNLRAEFEQLKRRVAR